MPCKTGGDGHASDCHACHPDAAARNAHECPLVKGDGNPTATLGT